jgi:hypothetical protein
MKNIEEEEEEEKRKEKIIIDLYQSVPVEIE